MTMRKKIMSGRCHRLVGVFNLFMACSPTGLSCFMSKEIPFPNTKELAEMVSSPSEDPGTRIDQNMITAYQQMIIERVEPIKRAIEENGGLDAIRRGFQYYREHEPGEIKLINDLTLIGKKYKTLQAVAKAHNMPPDMVRRHKDRTLEKIAAEIEMMRYSSGNAKS